MALTQNRPYQKSQGGGGAISTHGFDMFEVASALQKEIRRGNEEDAMYWALEFLPKYEGWLWRRLLVIANEDIGIADMNVVQFVTSQCNGWFTVRYLNGKNECKLVLANTILAMCRAEKCRLSDHFQIVVDIENDRNRHEIPDYALDKHTRRGKSMGRGVDHWLEHGAVLSPESEIEDLYAERAHEIWRAGIRDPNREWSTAAAAKKRVEQLSMFS